MLKNARQDPFLLDQKMAATFSKKAYLEVDLRSSNPQLASL